MRIVILNSVLSTSIFIRHLKKLKGLDSSTDSHEKSRKVLLVFILNKQSQKKLLQSIPIHIQGNANIILSSQFRLLWMDKCLEMSCPGGIIMDPLLQVKKKNIVCCFTIPCPGRVNSVIQIQINKNIKLAYPSNNTKQRWITRRWQITDTFLYFKHQKHNYGTLINNCNTIRIFSNNFSPEPPSAPE